jgi:hypothetical protein
MPRDKAESVGRVLSHEPQMHARVSHPGAPLWHSTNGDRTLDWNTTHAGGGPRPHIESTDDPCPCVALQCQALRREHNYISLCSLDQPAQNVRCPLPAAARGESRYRPTVALYKPGPPLPVPPLDERVRTRPPLAPMYRAHITCVWDTIAFVLYIVLGLRRSMRKRGCLRHRQLSNLRYRPLGLPAMICADAHPGSAP